MKFKIKSKLKIYNLEFIDSYKKKILDYDKNQLFIIDRNVFNLFFKNQIKIENFILIKSSEESKSYHKISNIINKILQKRLNKKSKIIAIGGGITQDITSFICSIYFRGIDWEFFPTTLLAQGDSCIGGKTSINFGKFKNQLGNFNPPSNIYIDIIFLKKLKKRDIESGIGEMAHLLAVRGIANFNSIKKYFKSEISLKDLIITSLQSKKYYIEKDEFDKKERKLLNFGHTFGHAIESATNYKIPHGVCVAYGCLIAFWISNKMNYLTNKNYLQCEKVLKLIINNKIKFNILEFKKAILRDKKANKNKVGFILSHGCGKMFIKEMKIDLIFLNNVKKFNSQIEFQ
jgi:3-dehydroquinate synthase